MFQPYILIARVPVLPFNIILLLTKGTVNYIRGFILNRSGAKLESGVGYFLGYHDLEEYI